MNTAVSPLRTTRAVGLLVTVTIALIALSAALLLWEMRRREVDRARVETVGLAYMFREQTDRTFDAADLVLRGVQERIQSAYGRQLPLDDIAVHLLLSARLLANRQIGALTLLDADGTVINSSRDDPQPRRSAASTEDYKTFANGKTDGLFIGKPAREPVTGAWTLNLARAFHGIDGSFRGVVVATMTIPRFDQFYSWMKLGYVRPIALYLADGTLVASVPHRENMIGDYATELSKLRLADVGNEMRMAIHVSGDGARHMFAFGRTVRFPLLVSVTNDEEPALAIWRERAVPIALGALLLCAFIVIAAMLLRRALTHEEAARSLRDAHNRYHRTIDSLMDAIVAVDGAQNIILFNPAAERMFGVTADAVYGTALEQLIPDAARGAHHRHIERFVQFGSLSRAMSPNIEINGVRSDGSEFPIESTISQTWIDGKPQLTAVLRDVTHKRRAEAEMREMNRQLRALSASLQNVREQERTRIAMELHDDLGQQLTGLKLELSWLVGRIREGRQATHGDIDQVRHQVDAAITAVRRIATELRPLVLDELGFGEAVTWQTGEFSKRSGIEVALALPAAASVKDDAVATGLYRIVQESLTNIARHAGATRVTVGLIADQNQLVLSVRDNGTGLAAGAREGGGLGLVSMRERATALGGQLSIRSVAGAGTTVEVILPLVTPVLAGEAA